MHEMGFVALRICTFRALVLSFSPFSVVIQSNVFAAPQWIFHSIELFI